MNKYRDSDIERVRAAADIAQVVGEYVRLKRAGMNRLVGLCPFHSEKSPSFTVDTVKQLYMCFGCHVSGNVIQFYMALEHVNFVKAVETLADRYGAILTARDLTPQAREDLRRQDVNNQELKRQAQWFTKAMYRRIEARKQKAWTMSQWCFQLFRRRRKSSVDPSLIAWLRKRAVYAERRALRWGVYLRRIEEISFVDAVRVYREYRKRHPAVVLEYEDWRAMEYPSLPTARASAEWTLSPCPRCLALLLRGESAVADCEGCTRTGRVNKFSLEL